MSGVCERLTFSMPCEGSPTVRCGSVLGFLRHSIPKVYTSPSTPVQGKITRILVGPDASKDKLKGQLGDLQQISGLSGVVMGFTPN